MFEILSEKLFLLRKTIRRNNTIDIRRLKRKVEENEKASSGAKEAISKPRHTMEKMAGAGYGYGDGCRVCDNLCFDPAGHHIGKGLGKTGTGRVPGSNGERIHSCAE